MQYSDQVTEIQNLLSNAQNILVSLPTSSSVDDLAAGLALFLSLQQTGKKVSIATDSTIRVSHTNLYGVGQIQSSLPEAGGGDLVIVLGGVASADGKIPAVEKLDYYATGSDWNLAFRVRPGQTLKPTSITPKWENKGFDLIFVIGAHNLTDLGSIRANNTSAFTGVNIINIDKSSSNNNFGKINIIDSKAASVSEITEQIITGLKLPLDQDIATNILAGIFSATSNLTDVKVNADTYEALANALRAGGKKPEIVASANQVTETPKEVVPSQTPVEEPKQQSQSVQPNNNIDLNQIFGANIFPANKESLPENQPSPEETPNGEEVITPEDDWLTPKIYKGSNIG